MYSSATRPVWFRFVALFLSLQCLWMFALATPVQALGLPKRAKKAEPAHKKPAPLSPALLMHPRTPREELLARDAWKNYKPAVSLSLWDEVGYLPKPVPATQVTAWVGELSKTASSREHRATVHLWLGEVALAQNQQPVRALAHFQQAQQLSKPTQPVYGNAAYDIAIVHFYQGAYKTAASDFLSLVKPKTMLRGYDRNNCTLFWRHALVCAQYHARRAKLGIPEPPPP